MWNRIISLEQDMCVSVFIFQNVRHNFPYKRVSRVKSGGGPHVFPNSIEVPDGTASRTAANSVGGYRKLDGLKEVFVSKKQLT